MTDTTEATPRGPGRPRNADRVPQHISTTPEREPAHDAAHTRPRTRTRMGRTSVVDDPYHIPLDQVPEGLSYEWKRWTVVGEEQAYYISQMRHQGWEVVSPRAHPHWFPPGFSEPHIIRGGLILMERPIELTNEAIEERRQMATRQINEAEERLGRTPKDTLTREHPDTKPRVEKGMFRPVPIED